MISFMLALWPGALGLLSISIIVILILICGLKKAPERTHLRDSRVCITIPAEDTISGF